MLLDYYNRAAAAEEARRNCAAERGRRRLNYRGPPSESALTALAVFWGCLAAILIVFLFAMLVSHVAQVEKWFNRWF